MENIKLNNRSQSNRRYIDIPVNEILDLMDLKD